MKAKSNIIYKNMALIVALMNIAFWDYFDNLLAASPFVILVVEAGIIWILRKSIELIEIKKVIVLSFIILFHQLVCMLQGYTSMAVFAKQYIMIVVCYVCYMIIFSGFSVKTIFMGYYVFAIITSFVVFFQEIVVLLKIPVIDKIPIVFDFTAYTYYVFAGLIRANAFFREPSFLVYALTPAVYVSLLIIINKFKETGKVYSKIFALMIVLSYLLSFSSIGLIGLMVMVAIIIIKGNWSWKTVLTILSAIVFFVVVYSTVPDVKMRVDDTIEALTVQDIKELGAADVNMSSITLISHVHLAKTMFVETTGWGVGLGAYGENYDKYMPEISEYSYLLGLNKEDANSMFLRMIGELGVLGVVLLIATIIHYYPTKVSKNDISYQYISDSIIVLIGLRLLRQGNYTHGGFFFFVCMYILIYYEVKQKSRNKEG